MRQIMWIKGCVGMLISVLAISATAQTTAPVTMAGPASPTQQSVTPATDTTVVPEPAAAARKSAGSLPLLQQRDFPTPIQNPAYQRPATTGKAKPLPSRAQIYAGQASVYSLPGRLKRVAVGNGDLVKVVNVGRSELVIMGQKAGATTLHLWLQDGNQIELPVDVLEVDTATVVETVRTLLADVDNLSVNAVADRVVITGLDINPGIATRIAAIQKIYPTVLDFTTADPVGMRPMVLMDVKIMEFDSNALEELGIEWDNMIQGPAAGLVKDFSNNDYYRINPDGSPVAGTTLPNRLRGTHTFFGIATQIGSAINLLMSKGKAYLLASPQLSARSGGDAHFLAGGEIPIPIPQGFGQVTIEYKEYGIKLDVEPLVNFNQDISARVLAEVSRVDPTVTVQGVPGFTTRRTESEINVHSGQTIVISGLIDSSAQQDTKKLPLLGDIPILGKLFRSDGFRGNRTELVMFVTPRVVSPDSKENIDGLERAREMEQRGNDIITPRNQEYIQ